VSQVRCPNSVKAETQTPHIYTAFESFTVFKNYKILPNEGCWLDQSAFFISIVNLCETITRAYETKKEEKDKLLRAMASKAKNRKAVR